MSVSTNAILFYGYAWTEEGDLFGDDSDSEWPKRLLLKRGEADPWDAYPDLEHLSYDQRKAAGDEWVAAHRAEIDAWRAKEKAVEAEFGVELEQHCSGECPMPYLAIAGAGEVARRGYAKPLPDLTVGADWDAKLDRWLGEFRIEKPNECPRWWLVSYWG